jgi:5-methylcytosine-specific restriction endonuclease McrA
MRQEFPDKTKMAAWDRCGGVCECGCLKTIYNRPEYHHILPASLGGLNDLRNCMVMRKACHDKITNGGGLDGNKAVKKSIRIAEKRAGLRAKGQGFRGWRTFSGEVRYAKDR